MSRPVKMTARDMEHGMRAWRHPLHSKWYGIKRRCEDPRMPSYPLYGGRGISLCDEWQEFWNFFRDMGMPPSPTHTIDRIDNDRGYEPGNCRWATPKEQTLNRRVVRFIEVDGKKLCHFDWARELGISHAAMYHRVKKFGDEAAVRMGPRTRPSGSVSACK